MRFAADENFDGRILMGLRVRMPDVDIVRVQDTDMYHAPDPELLAWLADQGRILLTHDVHTMPGFVFARVKAGLSVPGIIEVAADLSIGQAVDELTIMLGAGTPEDFVDRVVFVPLR